MSIEQLEQRLTAVERSVAELNRQVTAFSGGPSPTSKWWEKVPPMTEEEQKAFDEAAPYREYIRMTGDSPPPGWRPGDPIPEPDHWK